MARYLVTVADCAGVREQHYRKTFPEVLRLLGVLRRVCGTKYAYAVQNTDRCDVDGQRVIDGLTDEERDQL